MKVEVLKVEVLKVLLRAARVIPPRFAWTLGHALGRLASRLPLRDVRRCIAHLTMAFPEHDPRWIARTCERCFGHFGATALWTIVTWTRPPHTLRRGLMVEGREHLRDLVRAAHAGERTVVFTGHFGNWELLARVFGGLAPAAMIGRRLRDPALDALVHDLRTAGGAQLVYQDDDVRDLVRLLRRGTVVATLADQDVPHLAGCFVPWFGIAARTPVAPAALALVARVPVQPLLLYRRAGRWVLHAGPRTAFTRASSSRKEDRAATHQAIIAWTTAYEEALVRAQPEQWVWWHKRWRTRPDADGAAQAVV